MVGVIALTLFIGFVIFVTLWQIGQGYLSAFLLTLAILGSYFIGYNVGKPPKETDRDFWQRYKSSGWFDHQ